MEESCGPHGKGNKREVLLGKHDGRPLGRSRST